MPRPLSQKARQKAIEATQEMVAELGIGGFTIDGVARRSGVAKTTLYRHWRSGTALLIHALDCAIERFPSPDTGTLRGDLLEFFVSVVPQVSTPTHRSMLLELTGAAANDPELAALKHAMMHERTRPIRQIVQRAVDRGEVPPVDLEMATTFIQGPVLARILETDEPPTRRYLEQMVGLIATGLGAPELADQQTEGMEGGLPA